MGRLFVVDGVGAASAERDHVVDDVAHRVRHAPRAVDAGAVLAVLAGGDGERVVDRLPAYRAGWSTLRDDLAVTIADGRTPWGHWPLLGVWAGRRLAGLPVSHPAPPVPGDDKARRDLVVNLRAVVDPAQRAGLRATRSVSDHEPGWSFRTLTEV